MDSTKVKGGGIYILRFPNKHKYKWGKANSIFPRVKTLNTAHYKDLELISVIYPLNDEDKIDKYLYKIEKIIHDFLRDKHVCREWFSSEDIHSDIARVVKMLNDNGYNVRYTYDNRDPPLIKSSIISNKSISLLQTKTAEYKDKIQKLEEEIQDKQYELNDIATQYDKLRSDIYELSNHYETVVLAKIQQYRAIEMDNIDNILTLKYRQIELLDMRIKFRQQKILTYDNSHTRLSDLRT